MRTAEQSSLQEKIFWMKSGPLKSRYVYVWSEGYVEIEESPASPDHSNTQGSLLQLGDAHSNFDAVTTRLEQSGGLEVTVEEAGTLAFYFNLATYPGLEIASSHILKVFPALGVRHLQQAFKNIASLAESRLAAHKPSLGDEERQLNLKLRKMQKVLILHLSL